MQALSESGDISDGDDRHQLFAGKTCREGGVDHSETPGTLTRFYRSTNCLHTFGGAGSFLLLSFATAKDNNKSYMAMARAFWCPNGRSSIWTPSCMAPTMEWFLLAQKRRIS